MRTSIFAVSAFAVVLLSIGGAISQNQLDINDKVARLNIGSSTLDDVIRIFGEPQRYVWGGQTFIKDKLPSVYIAEYSNDAQIVIARGKVDEVRFEGPAAGYLYRGKIKTGSSLEEVLAVAGEPKETVVGQPCKYADGILYKDIDGRKGYCYYARRDKQVRFFFGDYKVGAIYLTGYGGEGEDSSVWRSSKLTMLPRYNPDSSDPFKVDLRSYDLSELNLRNSFDDLMHADFDDNTIWPEASRMPRQFDYKKIMELGKNPGLGVRKLHEKGITGRGVGIAIIDQKLLKNHQEYADRIKSYEEINVGSQEGPTMHGAAVASIAVGRNVGVAPEADLYYIASRTGDYGEGNKFTWNFTYYAQAINRILEINKDLPVDKKIRVIALQIGWSSGRKGYDEIMQAAQRAKSAGMLVISSSVEEVHGFKFHGLGRLPLTDPDRFVSFEPGAFWVKQFYNRRNAEQKDRLLVPMDSRTTANFTGPDDYVFYREGGWSWSIPYIAGVYALAAQVDPNITPERFWQTALDTGRTITIRQDGAVASLGPIIDPTSLINRLQRGKLRRISHPSSLLKSPDKAVNNK